MLIGSLLPALASAQLVSLFTFDGDTSGMGGIVRDQGVGANDGSLIGTATIGADTPDASLVTRSGQVLQLDGNSDFSIHGSRPTLNLTGDMTLSAWVRRSGSQNHTVVANELAGNGGYFLEVNSADKSRYFTFGTTDTSLTSGESVANDTWTHVAATYDGANKRVYFDGVEVTNSPEASTGSLTSSSDPFMIGFGMGSANAANYFNGSIDDVAVFNQALTASQISDIANGDFSAFTTVEPLPTARVDFGLTGHTLQGGFVREEGASNSGVTSITTTVANTFGGPATTLDITVSEAGGDALGLEHRIRNTVTGTGVDDVLEDLIATRDNQLTVTLEDLAPGVYEFTSYHNDATANGFEAGSIFDVFLNGDLVLSDIDATNEFGAVDLADVAIANFSFSNFAQGDVTIDFIGTAANVNGFIPLSGLELVQTATVPEPASIAIWTLLGAIGVFWYWRRRRAVA